MEKLKKIPSEVSKNLRINKSMIVLKKVQKEMTEIIIRFYKCKCNKIVCKIIFIEEFL